MISYRKIDEDTYKLLSNRRSIKVWDLDRLSDWWSNHLNYHVNFDLLYGAVSTYRWNGFYAEMFAKPHMEGMVEIRIKYQNNLDVLKIPVSVYHDSILIHTIQGTLFETRQVLENLKDSNISLRAIGISFIEHMASINILFQRPDQNIWHKNEMVRRQRYSKGREFSIYESVMRKYYYAKNVEEFYHLLSNTKGTTLTCLNGMYYPAPKDLTLSHPTYLLRLNKDQAYFMEIADLSWHYRFKNLLVEITFLPIAPPGFEPGSRGPEPRILDH